MLIPWILTILISLASIGWIIRSLFGDSARGRRRCPKCWYLMVGTTGMTCSECGYRARTERQLFRSRRRWRGVAIGLLALAAGANLPVLSVYRDGTWGKYAPRSVLILLFPTMMQNEGFLAEMVVADPQLDKPRDWWKESWGEAPISELPRWQKWLFGYAAAAALPGVVDDRDYVQGWRHPVPDAFRQLGPYGKPALGTVREWLEGDDIDRRLEAINLIENIGTPAKPLLPRLIELLQNDDGSRNTAPVGALARAGAGDRRASMAVIRLFDVGDEWERAGVCQAVGLIGPVAREAMPYLLLILNDDTVRCRAQAARALGRIARDEDIHVRDALIEAIARGDRRIAMPAFEGLAKHPGWHQEALLQLGANLKSNDRDRVVTTATGLAWAGTGGEALLPALHEVEASSEDALVREAAQFAIRGIESPVQLEDEDW